jgi:hypothetical protein
MHDNRMKATSFRVDSPLPDISQHYLGGVNSDDDIQRSALSWFSGFCWLGDFSCFGDDFLSCLGKGFGFFMQASFVLTWRHETILKTRFLSQTQVLESQILEREVLEFKDLKLEALRPQGYAKTAILK